MTKYEKKVRISILSFVKNIKRTVSHIKMAAKKMRIVDILTQYYVSAQMTHKNVSSELPLLDYQRYKACPVDIRQVRTKSTQLHHIIQRLPGAWWSVILPHLLMRQNQH